MIGKKVLHYQIEEKLGQGGMGVVYRARDTRLDRTVALKFLPPNAVSADADRERLFIEARAAAALSHPNISTIYGIEEADGELFIAMEYLDGESLERRLERGPLGIDETVRLARDLAIGLQTAHDSGVIHRDIKTANIMLSQRGPVLLDFGLAKSQSGTAVTQTGVAVGTPRCMSPEQAHGDFVDHRTDIWSLGVVLYEALTGVPPFAGDQAMAVIYSILNKEPTPPRERIPGIPRALEQMVLKMLAKDPRRRFATAREVVDAIDALESGEVRVADTGEKPPPSIAVLPFENMSADPEQEYFCDGIAEDVINDLTRIEGVRVAARTTSFAYKGKREDIRDLGRAIGVSTVLEGSVRKAGNRVRVTAQLINVTDGYHMWSERYDRDLEDVFAIQEEIARNIVEALKVELTDEEDQKLATPDTRSVEAYDVYLRGREHLLKLSLESSMAARDLFIEAITMDPTFARAHAGLANYYVHAHSYFNVETDPLMKAVAAAKRAIELDPNLAEAHVALGYTLSAEERFDEAEREFQKALEANPGLFEAHYYRGRAFYVRGDMKRAIDSFQRATSLDPNDFQTWALLASIHAGAGRTDLAELCARPAIERALEHMKANPTDCRSAYHAAGCSLLIGEIDQAVELSKRSIAIAPDDPGVYYNAACLHAQIDRIDEALDNLDRSIDHGFTQKNWIENDPDLDSLRDHPRYREILDRIS